TSHIGDVIGEIAPDRAVISAERRAGAKSGDERRTGVAQRRRRFLLTPCTGTREHRSVPCRATRGDLDDAGEGATAVACGLRARAHDDALDALERNARQV